MEFLPASSLFLAGKAMVETFNTTYTFIHLSITESGNTTLPVIIELEDSANSRISYRIIYVLKEDDRYSVNQMLSGFNPKELYYNITVTLKNGKMEWGYVERIESQPLTEDSSSAHEDITEGNNS